MDVFWIEVETLILKEAVGDLLCIRVRGDCDLNIVNELSVFVIREVVEDSKSRWVVLDAEVLRNHLDLGS